MIHDLVLVYHNMRVIKKMPENEQARTRVWLPVECEADVEPDTDTELSSDDEQCILRRICVYIFYYLAILYVCVCNSCL